MSDTLTKLEDHIAEFEGGYSNNPNDHGGETMRGITWGTFLSLAPKLGMPATKERFLQLSADDFRKFVAYFWKISKADKLNPSIGAFVTQFRWGGATRIPEFFNKIFAAKGIQDRVPSNTYLTDTNVRTINKLPAQWVFDQLHAMRMASYKQRVADDPSQGDFLKGWTRRANAFYELFSPEKKKV